MYANVTVQLAPGDSLAKASAEDLATDVLTALGGNGPPTGTDMCQIQITQQASTAPVPAAPGSETA